MKIYVDEMPRKVAQRTIHFEDGNLNCVELMFDSNIEPTKIVSINQSETKALKERWEKLKGFIFNRQYCTGYEVQIKLILDILDKMDELEKEGGDEE